MLDLTLPKKVIINLQQIGTTTAETNPHQIGTTTAETNPHQIGTTTAETNPHQIGTTTAKTNLQQIGTTTAKTLSAQGSYQQSTVTVFVCIISFMFLFELLVMFG